MGTEDIKLLFGFLILVILLLLSAIISGSEVAFFSLTPNDLSRLRKEKTRKALSLLSLTAMPDKVLSTILVANNLVNVGIIILSAFLSESLLGESMAPVARFIVEVVAITFIILLFGEIMPKVYATRNHFAVAYNMAVPLSILEKALRPGTAALMFMTKSVRKRSLSRKKKISMNDLSDALDLTADKLEEEKKILKGIVNFGNISVSAIMCPRVDVTALDITEGFSRVIPVITESGYSRIPVYSGSFDNVKGILYAKDVLPYAGSPDSFKWQSLIRPPYFVPETKKINELLKEFQLRKIHMAVVIDEYGGTSGIVTLEDILEEIVGEISDESDVDTPLYRKVDENTYIFEGKILLNDFYKILSLDRDPFADVKGEAETLAGLVLELTGEIPKRNQTIEYGPYIFTIESSDKRRIKEIRVNLKSDNAGSPEE
ncbi:MAG TPA: gliding motility-associated protein GldE [Bacteroidales bacterium]|nr:gliding motility-associated protein GldE [Bacteroidales bacterium]